MLSELKQFEILISLLSNIVSREDDKEKESDEVPTPADEGALAGGGGGRPEVGD